MNSMYVTAVLGTVLFNETVDVRMNYKPRVTLDLFTVIIYGDLHNFLLMVFHE